MADVCPDCGRPEAADYREWTERGVAACGDAILEDSSCLAYHNERLKGCIRALESELAELRKREECALAIVTEDSDGVVNVTRRDGTLLGYGGSLEDALLSATTYRLPPRPEPEHRDDGKSV